MGNFNQSRNNNNRGGSGDNRFVSKAGIRPNREMKVTYNISTTQVRQWLQNKLDVLLKNAGQDEVQFNLITINVAKNFAPMMAIFPMDVIQPDAAFEDIDPIFREDHDDKPKNINPVIKKLFEPYTYPESDKQIFRSRTIKRDWGIENRFAPILEQLITPTILPIGNNGAGQVCFLLDVIKIFYYMLEMDEDKRDYEIQIQNWQNQKSGEYTYRVARCIKGKNKKTEYNEGTFNARFQKYIRDNNR